MDTMFYKFENSIKRKRISNINMNINFCKSMQTEFFMLKIATLEFLKSSTKILKN